MRIEMTKTATYTGGCHCGKVRYEVTADLSQTMTCNCSICGKTGAILTFAPASEFTLLSGEGELTDYQFNKQIIHHLFCTTCGIRSFGRGKNPDGSDAVAVNVRCLDGVDVTMLTPFAYDGKSV